MDYSSGQQNEIKYNFVEKQYESILEVGGRQGSTPNGVDPGGQWGSTATFGGRPPRNVTGYPPSKHRKKSEWGVSRVNASDGPPEGLGSSYLISE